MIELFNILNGLTVKLLHNTPGQEDFKKGRPLAYPKSYVFIIAFSLVSPTSLDYFEYMWIPEIQEHCPRTPYILVGLRLSLRDEYISKGWDFVSTAMGEEMKRKICAAYYIECDALEHINLKEVFELAIKCVINPLLNYENLYERNQRLEQERANQLKAEKEAEKARRKEEKLRIKEVKKAEKEKKSRKNEQKQDEKKRRIAEIKQTMKQTKFSFTIHKNFTSK